jgi:aryl-alcohol dehydrogenase-like predicted oxidoreductase
MDMTSRRDVLRSGVAAGLALAIQGPARAAAVGSDAAHLLPITKAIPSTGEKLPIMGLGTDQFRDSERAAIQAEIKRMQEMGGTVIDTAAAYGDSEAIIGDSLATLGIRDRMFIATKLTANEAGNSTRSGEESFAHSLERLKTKRIDLLQVHNLEGVEVLMPVLQRWKKEGRIRYFGVTTSRVGQHSHMVEYMRQYPLDFVQVDYSLANREAATSVLPVALERRIAVLANIPFGFGSVLRQAQARKLPDWAADIDVTSWSQFLLKYVASHPAVTCVIPGSTKVEHLEENQRAGRGRLPDEAMRKKMEAAWDAG